MDHPRLESGASFRCLNCQNHMFVLSIGSSLTGMHGCYSNKLTFTKLPICLWHILGITLSQKYPRNRLASFKCSKDSTVAELEKYGYNNICPWYGTLLLKTNFCLEYYCLNFWINQNICVPKKISPKFIF